MENLFYIFLGLIGFGLLIFLHELGHYILAKRQGMVIEVFSIGFGRPILQWKFQGVSWQIGILPFGGFVKIKGMDAEDKSKIHEEKNSFFGTTPLSRLKVAIAGPLVNIILAFVFFSLIWLMGGREKYFSENTKIVGYVEKGSRLDQLGLKAGDHILQVGDRKINNFTDLLESAVIAGENVQLIGYHVNEQTGSRVPFDLQYSLKLDPDQFQKTLQKIRETLQPARYLIAHKQTDDINTFSGSPMKGKNIQNQDRLLWVDGQIIYSAKQLQDILMKQEALLTIERDGKVFVTHVPRIIENLLYIPGNFKQEIDDWKYELGLTNDKALYLIPYSFDKKGFVRDKILSNQNTNHFLQIGDQILAVDGKKITGGLAIIDALQKHEVSVVLQRSRFTPFDWQTQDEYFEKSLNRSNLNQLINQLGLTDQERVDDLILYKGIIPKSMLDFAQTNVEKTRLNEQIKESQNAILQIRDPKNRKIAMNQLEEELNRPLLGVALTEKQVQYNPNPIASFVTVYQSTFRTLKSLIIGNLSPKWLSGPVGMMQVMHRSFGISIKEGLFWLGIISLNLGILNLLPIPVLDGGYIFISVYEIITRKKVTQKTLQRLMLPFFILIIFLFVFSTFHDLSRLWQSLS